MTKPLFTVVVSVLLVLALSAAAYSAGYSKAEKRYEAQLNAVMAEAQRREREWVDRAIERDRAANERLKRYKAERTDEPSIEWAAVDLPDGERQRMLAALSDISAGASRTAD